jgi:hypothetical protein
MDIIVVSTLISVLFICFIIRNPDILGKIFEK